MNIILVNLISYLYCSIEVGVIEVLLCYVFFDICYFRVNLLLLSVLLLLDEGVVNYMWIGGCGNVIYVLVYGYDYLVVVLVN